MGATFNRLSTLVQDNPDSIMDKPIKIVTWNANGLAKHRQKIKIFIFSQNIDILLVSETDFTNKSYCCFPRYTLYHTMHPDGKAHEGIALIVRSNIKHYKIGKFQTEFLQATSITLEDRSGRIIISAIYSPPKRIIKKEQYINFLKTLGNRFIYRRRRLQCQTHALRIEIDPTQRTWIAQSHRNNEPGNLSTREPTYWPSNNKETPYLLDFGIMKDIAKNCCRTESCLELSSNHCNLYYK